MTQTTWLLVSYCGLILLVSVFGGLVPLRGVLTHTRLQLYLSFGSGVMLGAAMFHMLPHAVHMVGIDSVALPFWFATLGLLALFLTERFFSSHHHELHEEEHGSKLSWPAAVVGLTIHTLIAGVALASAVDAGQTGHGEKFVGWGVFLAIVLHKPADSLTIVSLMMRSRSSHGRAHLVNLLFALVVPLGVVLFFTAQSLLDSDLQKGFTAYALAFSAGTFLCISLSDLLPELHFHEHDRGKLTTALLAGVILMFGAGLLENHDHAHDHQGEHELIHEHDEHEHDEDEHHQPEHSLRFEVLNNRLEQLA